MYGFFFLGPVETFEKVFSVIPSFLNFTKLSIGGSGDLKPLLSLSSESNEAGDGNQIENRTICLMGVMLCHRIWFSSEAKMRLPNAAFQT